MPYNNLAGECNIENSNLLYGKLKIQTQYKIDLFFILLFN